jgi:predicted house-cleaning NTP pyrophosphatase (Maf/HAM1 superfamily)
VYILSPTISQNLYWNYENCKRITTRISVAFSLQKRKETARQKRTHRIIVAADFVVCGSKTKRKPRRAREQGK